MCIFARKSRKTRQLSWVSPGEQQRLRRRRRRRHSIPASIALNFNRGNVKISWEPIRDPASCPHINFSSATRLNFSTSLPHRVGDGFLTGTIYEKKKKIPWKHCLLRDKPLRKVITRIFHCVWHCWRVVSFFTTHVPQPLGGERGWNFAWVIKIGWAGGGGLRGVAWWITMSEQPYWLTVVACRSKGSFFFCSLWFLGLVWTALWNAI